MPLTPTPGDFRPGMLTREACDMLNRMAKTLYGRDGGAAGGLDVRELSFGPQYSVRKSALAPTIPPTQISISARQDDFSPGIYEYLPVSATAGGFGFSGFQFGYLGKILTIRNVGSNAFTMYQTNSFSASQNQLYNNTNADVLLAQSEAVQYIYDGSKWAQIGDATVGTFSPPIPSTDITFSGARLGLISTGSVANQTETILTFNNTPVFDTDGYKASTSRLKIPVGFPTAYYQFGAECIWTTISPTNCYRLHIYKNSVDLFGQTTAAGAGSLPPSIEQSLSTMTKLSAGDFIEAYVYQNSGGAQTLGGTGALWIARLGV